MTRLTSVIAGSFLGIAAAFAASFEPYPGAKLDEGLTRESNRMAAQAGVQYGTSQIWTTSASFDQVLAFYQKTDAKEFVMRTPFSTGPHEETLPPQVVQGAPADGLKVQKAIFILDGAPDLQNSKSWLQIVHPVIGKQISMMPPLMGDVRDLTGITYVHKR